MGTSHERGSLKQDTAHRPTRFSDEVLDDTMASILRSKTPAERLAIGFRLWNFAQQTLTETLRRDHPEWSDAELRRRVARRMSHGADWATRLGVVEEWNQVQSRVTST